MAHLPPPPDVNRPQPAGGRLIRQPYRITMAGWNGTVNEKRILTAIIASLQKEIAWVEKGMPLRDLPLLAQNPTMAILSIPLRQMTHAGNNHSIVHKTLQQMEQSGIVLRLPEVKGRKGPSIAAEQLRIRIQRMPSKDRREIRLGLTLDTLTELLRTTSGLTIYSPDVLTGMRSFYAMRIYEILSHWKDRETLQVSLSQMREWLTLQDKLPETKEFLRKVIAPACHQLKERADVFCHLKPVRVGNRITRVQFQIQQHMQEKEMEQIHLRLREQLTNILRIRFGWKNEHFRRIGPILDDSNRVRELNEKVGRLWHFLDHNSHEIRNIPKWSLKAVLNVKVEDQIQL